MIRKKLLILITSLTIIFSLAACGRTQDPTEDIIPQISMRVFNGVIQYQIEGQDSWSNLLSVSELEGQDGVGVQSASINNLGELIVTYTNDRSENLGVVQGQNAQTPLSVVSFNINSAGELEVTYSDDSTQNLGQVRQPVATPRQVQSFTVNAQGELIVVYNDATSENLGPVVGPSGTPGAIGQDGVIGQDGLSAYDLYVASNPLYTKDVSQWLIDLQEKRLSSADYFDVMTAADIADVAANRPEVTSIQLQSNITGDVAFTRPLNINFNGYDVKGNISITSSAIANITFENLLSNSSSVITGSLTVDLANTTLTNHINVGGDVVINAIGTTSYNAFSEANSIILRGPGHVSLPVTQSAIPVIVETAEPVELSGNLDQVSINMTNASVGLRPDSNVGTLIVNQLGVRLNLGQDVVVTTLNSERPVNVALGKDAAVTTPPGGGNFLQRATLSFSIQPTGAALVVKDSDGSSLTPTALNTFEVIQGQTYTYTVTSDNFVKIEDASITIDTATTTQTVSLQEALLVSEFNGSNGTLTLTFNRPIYVEDLEIKDGNVTYFGDFVPVQEAWGNITPSIVLGWLLQTEQYVLGTAGYTLNYDFANFLGEDLQVTASSITMSITSNSISFTLPAGSISSGSITTEAAIKELVTLNTSFFHLEDEIPFDGEALKAVFEFNKVNDAIVASLLSQAQYSSVSIAALSAIIDALPTTETFAYNVTNLALNAQAQALKTAIEEDPLRSLATLPENALTKLQATQTLISSLENWNDSNVFDAANNATGSALAVVVRFVDENSVFVRRLDLVNDSLIIATSSTLTLNLGVFAPSYSSTILSLQPGDIIYLTGGRSLFNGLKQISSVTRLDLYTTGAIVIDESEDISLLDFAADLEERVGTLVALDEYVVTGIIVTDTSITVTLNSLITPNQSIDMVYRGNVPARSDDRSLLASLVTGSVVNITSMALDWFNGPRLRFTNASEIEIVQEIEFTKLVSYFPTLFPASTYLDLDLFDEFNFGGWNLEVSWESDANTSLTTQGAVSLTTNAVTAILTATLTPTGISSGSISATSVTVTIVIPALDTMSSALNKATGTVAVDGVISKVISENLILIETTTDSLFVWDESAEGAFANLNKQDEIRVIGSRVNVGDLKVVNVATDVSRISVLRNNVTLPGVLVELSASNFEDGELKTNLQGKRISTDDFVITAIEVTSSAITLTLEQLVSEVAITLVYEGALNLPLGTHLQSFVTGQAILLTNVAVGAGVVFYTDASEIQSSTLSAVHMQEYFNSVVSIPTSTTEDITLPPSFTQGQNTFNITWSSTNVEFIDATGRVTKPAIYEADENTVLTAEFSYLGEIVTTEFNVTIAAVGQVVFTETFEDTPLTATYLDGTFVGSSNLEWTYGHSRNAGDFAINGGGIMLRRGSDSFLEVTLPNGFASITFDYRKAFTSAAPRQLELLVNDVQVMTTPIFGDSSGEDTTVFTFEYIPEEPIIGEVTLRVRDVQRNSTNRQVVIDNVVIIGTALPFDEQINAILQIPEQVFENEQLNLQSEVVLTDGEIYNIQWTSSDYGIITRRGFVRGIETSFEEVTLTAQVFIDDNLIKTFTYLVEVQAPLTIAQAIEITSGKIVVEGVVTSIVNNLNLTVQDETGAIVIRLSSIQLQRLNVGDYIRVVGTRGQFNGLRQIVNQTSDYEVTIISSNNPLPSQLNLNEFNFELNAHLDENQSKIITVENAVVESVITGFHSLINLYLPLLDQEIQLRLDGNLPNNSVFKSLLEGLTKNTVITLSGVTVDWFNGPRLAVNSTSLITSSSVLSTEAMEAYIQNRLFDIPNNLTENIVLPVENSLFGFDLVITWTSSKPEFLANDGTVTRPSENQENQTVTLSALITSDDFEDITLDFVVVIPKEFTLIYSTDFTSAEGKTSYALGTMDDQDYTWELREALRGSESSDKKVGTHSIRGRIVNSSTDGFAILQNDFEDLRAIEFQYANYGSLTTGRLSLYLSSDGGETWVEIWTQTEAKSDLQEVIVLLDFDELNFSPTDTIRIKFGFGSTTTNQNNSRLNLAEVKIFVE